MIKDIAILVIGLPLAFCSTWWLLASIRQRTTNPNTPVFVDVGNDLCILIVLIYFVVMGIIHGI
jgi:hypothetical protein